MRGPAGPRRGSALLEIGLISDGAILIRGRAIQALGPSRQIQNLAAARDCEEIDATGRVILPAFVDLETTIAHAHLAPRNFERLFRNYGNPDPESFRDIVQEGGRGIAALSSKSLKHRANVITRRMLQHGTGTVETRAGYVLEESDIHKVLRVQTECGEPLDVYSSLLLQLTRDINAAAWSSTTCQEYLPALHRRRLARLIDLQYDRNTIPEAAALNVLHCAKHLGFITRASTDFFSSYTAVAVALQAAATSVGSLRCITKAEVEALAGQAVLAILKPGFALQTGMTYAEPGRAMVDAGVAPVLASGYHPELSPSFNMQLIVLLACRFYRWRPEEALSAATINGACALRAESRIGSLESGKQADLLILNVSDYREAAYYAGVNVVDKVIKRGELVYDSKSSVHDEE